MRTAILTALFTAGLSVLAGCEATSGAKAPVNAVMGDGSVRSFSASTSWQISRALASSGRGEIIND